LVTSSTLQKNSSPQKPSERAFQETQLEGERAEGELSKRGRRKEEGKKLKSKEVFLDFLVHQGRTEKKKASASS